MILPFYYTKKRQTQYGIGDFFFLTQAPASNIVTHTLWLR